MKFEGEIERETDAAFLTSNHVSCAFRFWSAVGALPFCCSLTFLSSLFSHPPSSEAERQQKTARIYPSIIGCQADSARREREKATMISELPSFGNGTRTDFYPRPPCRPCPLAARPPHRRPRGGHPGCASDTRPRWGPSSPRGPEPVVLPPQQLEPARGAGVGSYMDDLRGFV